MSKKPTNRAEAAIARHGSTPGLQEQRRMHALSEAIRASVSSGDFSGGRTVTMAKAFEAYLTGKTK